MKPQWCIVYEINQFKQNVYTKSMEKNWSALLSKNIRIGMRKTMIFLLENGVLDIGLSVWKPSRNEFNAKQGWENGGDTLDSMIILLPFFYLVLGHYKVFISNIFAFVLGHSLKKMWKYGKTDTGPGFVLLSFTLYRGLIESQMEWKERKCAHIHLKRWEESGTYIYIHFLLRDKLYIQIYICCVYIFLRTFPEFVVVLHC